jgi:coenzyme F420-dependent glucose-6-phosphate dehydrogenase
MVQIGYALSSEEHEPNDLVRNARRAEEAGFTFALISDHYHPWTDRQGHSPFVWSVLGAIAHATDRIQVGTGVTCPTVRIHPAIIAQSAATAAAMMPGRFFLGVGTGENLNEHIFGDPWPEPEIRLQMLEEAVDIIRLLWQGGMRSYYGVHYNVVNARLYTLPGEPPPIMVAAAGPKAVETAARIGDGLIALAPDPNMIERFSSGARGRPRYAQVTVCYAEDEAEARRTAHRLWPISAMKGQFQQDLALPLHFEQVAELVTEEQVAERTVCGPDPDRHIELIRKFAQAGYDHIYVHQVGPEQEPFFRFYEREVLPKLRGLGGERRKSA